MSRGSHRFPSSFLTTGRKVTPKKHSNMTQGYRKAQFSFHSHKFILTCMENNKPLNPDVTDRRASNEAKLGAPRWLRH